MKTRIVPLLCLLVGALVFPACEELGDVTDSPLPTTIEPVSEQAVNGVAGEALAEPLQVRVLDASGEPVRGVAVGWEATGGTLGATSTTTNAAGEASVGWTLSQTAGEYQANANVPGLTPATFTATVMAGPAVELELSQESVTFSTTGETQQVDVVAVRDQYGNEIEEPAVTWASGDAAVATVDEAGVIEATGSGSTSVTATVDDAEASVAVTVEEADRSVSVRATLDERAVAADLTISGDGIPDPIHVAMTLTGGAAEATVDVPVGDDRVFSIEARDSDDVLYARGATTATIDADTEVQVELAAITESVTVRADVAAHVASASVEGTGSAIDTARAAMSISGGTASVTLDMPVGAARSFQVTAFDEGGVAVGRGSADAAVTEGAPADVVVTLEALEGNQPIVGTFGSFTLVLSPGDTTTGVGETIQFSATVLDQDGNEVEGASVTWASSNPAIASVDANGEVTTLALGTTRISISYNGFGVTAQLSVEP